MLCILQNKIRRAQWWSFSLNMNEKIKLKVATKKCHTLLCSRCTWCPKIHAFRPESLGQNLIHQNFVVNWIQFLLFKEKFPLNLLKSYLILSTNFSNSLLYLLVAISFQAQLLFRTKMTLVELLLLKVNTLKDTKFKTNRIFMRLNDMICLFI